MSFSGNVRPPAVDAEDAMEATDVPDVRRGITPDVRRTGCAALGDCGIGEDIYFSLYDMSLVFAAALLSGLARADTSWFWFCETDLCGRWKSSGSDVAGPKARTRRAAGLRQMNDSVPNRQRILHGVQASEGRKAMPEISLQEEYPS